MAGTKAENSPTFYITEGHESLRDVAIRTGIEDADLLRLNPDRTFTEPLAKSTVVNCGYVSESDAGLQVSASAALALFAPKGKSAPFSDVLLAIQQELAVLGLLNGEFVTGTANRDTITAFRLWKQVLGYSDAEVGDLALAALGTRRNRFTVVD